MRKDYNMTTKIPPQIKVLARLKGELFSQRASLKSAVQQYKDMNVSTLEERVAIGWLEAIEYIQNFINDTEEKIEKEK